LQKSKVSVGLGIGSVVMVCASVRSFLRNCTKLFGTDFSWCWREALVHISHSLQFGTMQVCGTMR